MKIRRFLSALGLATLFISSAFAQITVPLAGRSLNKLLPDYAFISDPRDYVGEDRPFLISDSKWI